MIRDRANAALQEEISVNKPVKSVRHTHRSGFTEDAVLIDRDGSVTRQPHQEEGTWRKLPRGVESNKNR